MDRVGGAMETGCTSTTDMFQPTKGNRLMRHCFVDVDGTLISKDDQIRSYIPELIRGLRELDCSIVIWSAGGAIYASDKWNMICNRLFHLYGEYLYEEVQVFAWKLDWESKAIIGDHFYIDDHESILETAEKRGHGTHLVPFYTATGERDRALLDALEAARRFFDGRQTERDAGEIA